MVPTEEPNENLVQTRIPLHIRFWLSLKSGVVGKLLIIWAVTIILAFTVLYFLQNKVLVPDDAIIELWSAQFYWLIALALVCEYVDSTLGMGYGTTLTPLLLLLPLGLDPLQIVPAILISELVTGIAGGFSHHKAGNLDLNPKSMHFKIAMVLAACSVVGAVVAVNIAINIEKDVLKAFIGFIVLGVGIVLLAVRGRRFRFSWRKILALGLVASFNKALSGGGYGPLVMGGQLLSGVDEKPAIGITSIAEGLTCLVGVICFLIAGTITDLSLALALVIGAISSLPFCAYTVRQVQQRWLIKAIAVLTIVLGSWTLYRVFFQ